MPSGVNRKEMYRLVNIVYYLIETQSTSIPYFLERISARALI